MAWRADRGSLLIATHHGLYRARIDNGETELVSERTDDFLGFTQHPADEDILYASGHPGGGGNLGSIASRDGCRSWSSLSPGVGGPVDFHQMDVSKADPSVIYGAWEFAHELRRPVSLVETTGDGAVFAFMLGSELIRAEEPPLNWQPVSNGFGNRYLLHLAVDPGDLTGCSQ